MRIACLIHYRIDPFKRDAFATYAENWGHIIPRCGGDLVGYLLPHEGSNDIAWGLVAFDGMAEYETYRARLKAGAEGCDNLRFAHEQRLILRERRSWMEVVDGAFRLQADAEAPA